MIDSNIYVNTRITPTNSCCRQSVLYHELGHALGLGHTTEHCVMYQGCIWRHNNGHETPSIGDDDEIGGLYGS